MSFLVVDGFDSYKIGSDFNAGWLGGSPVQTDGRISGDAFGVIFGNAVYQRLNATVIGFAFRNKSDPGWWGAGGPICYQLDPLQTCGVETNVCPGSPFIVDFKTGLGLDAANRLFLFTTSWTDTGSCPSHPDKCDKWEAGSTMFYGWGETPALNFGEWNYVEFNTATLEVRLNGETIITSGSTATTHGTAYSESGIDEARVYLTVPTLHNGIDVDDFYAQDSGGSFVGDLHIETVYPDADGHYTAWTPGPGGSGTDHFTRVDETTMDGDKSYNLSETNGQRDSYVMHALSISSGTIIATQLSLAASLGNGLLETSFQPFIRQGGTDYDGDTVTLSAFDETGSGYWRAAFLSEQDPLGADWSIANVNGNEYGIHLETVST